jgi:hypothetical protein
VSLGWGCSHGSYLTFGDVLESSQRADFKTSLAVRCEKVVLAGFLFKCCRSYDIDQNVAFDSQSMPSSFSCSFCSVMFSHIFVFAINHFTEHTILYLVEVTVRIVLIAVEPSLPSRTRQAHDHYTVLHPKLSSTVSICKRNCTSECSP